MQRLHNRPNVSMVKFSMLIYQLEVEIGAHEPLACTRDFALFEVKCDNRRSEVWWFKASSIPNRLQIMYPCKLVALISQIRIRWSKTSNLSIGEPKSFAVRLISSGPSVRFKNAQASPYREILVLRCCRIQGVGTNFELLNGGFLTN